MRTNDGQVLRATTPSGIVQELNKRSLCPSGSNRQFMRDASMRVMVQLQKRVRTNNEENFVADLLEHGLLVDEDEVQSDPALH